MVLVPPVLRDGCFGWAGSDGGVLPVLRVPPGPRVKIVLHVQMVLQVQTVPTTVRVLSVVVWPPVFAAPTVIVLHTHAAPTGCAGPAAFGSHTSRTGSGVVTTQDRVVISDFSEAVLLQRSC